MHITVAAAPDVVLKWIITVFGSVNAWATVIKLLSLYFSLEQFLVLFTLMLWLLISGKFWINIIIYKMKLKCFMMDYFQYLYSYQQLWIRLTMNPNVVLAVMISSGFGIGTVIAVGVLLYQALVRNYLKLFTTWVQK